MAVRLLGETSTTLWIRNGIDWPIPVGLGSSYDPQRVASPVSGILRIQMYPYPSDTKAVLKDRKVAEGYSGRFESTVDAEVCIGLDSSYTIRNDGRSVAYFVLCIKT